MQISVAQSVSRSDATAPLARNVHADVMPRSASADNVNRGVAETAVSASVERSHARASLSPSLPPNPIARDCILENLS